MARACTIHKPRVGRHVQLRFGRSQRRGQRGANDQDRSCPSTQIRDLVQKDNRKRNAVDRFKCYDHARRVRGQCLHATNEQCVCESRADDPQNQ